MPLPAAIEMVQGRFGTSMSIFGEDVAMRVEVRPTHDLVWGATAQPVLSFGKVFTVAPGIEGTFSVPAVNQPGWKLQSTLDPFTMWAYIIDITYTASGGTKKRTITWQPLTGQGSVDLDLIGGGPILAPVNGEFAVVTSIGPFTGDVSIEDLETLGIGTDPSTTTATWANISGKPAVIAAGTSIATARAAINAQAAGDYKTGAEVAASISTAINALVNGAPGALDTLKELADALSADDSDIAAINTAIAARATTTYVDQQLAEFTVDYGALPTGVPLFRIRTSAIPNPPRPDVSEAIMVMWFTLEEGLGTPTTWGPNDVEFLPDVAAEIVATLSFTANAEEGTNGATITNSAPSPWTYKDLGSGTNTQTYSNATPALTGSLAYRIMQILGGTQSNLGITGISGQDLWALTVYFLFETMPTQSGGGVFLRAFTGADVTTATNSVFTCYVNTAGNLMLYAGSGATPGSNQVKIAETGVGVIAANSKRRVRLGADVLNNKMRMVVDSGPTTTVKYDSGWFTPTGTGQAMQFTGYRIGFGSTGSTAATALRFEAYHGAVASGTTPGLLTV